MSPAAIPSSTRARRTAARRGRGVVLAGLVLSLVLSLVLGSGCARVTPDALKPAPTRSRMRPEASLMTSGGAVVEGRDLSRLARLSGVFYERVSNRRFNSIATYQDPALHEFFQSLEAFSDYYADLVEELEDAHFEAVRPHTTQIQQFSLDPEDESRVWIQVLFVGENGLPLRFWDTDLVRRDQWREVGGRWWIIPEKL